MMINVKSGHEEGFAMDSLTW